MLTMILQSLVLAAGLLALVCVVGYGAVAWSLPGRDGWELLAVPAVGWAIAAVAVQWLNSVVRSAPALLIVVGAGVVASGAALVVQRGQLRAAARARRYDLAWVLGIGTATYLALLTFVYAAGLFSLDSGINTDTLWLYAPVAEYLKTHAFPFWVNKTLVLDRPANLSEQALFIHAFLYPALGQLDAAISVLARWQVSTLLDPLDAWCIAGALPGVYLFAAHGLGMARRTAVAATLLCAAQPLAFWMMGMGFVAQTRAVPLVPVSLYLLVRALRDNEAGAAVLAGIVAAPVLALYFPAFVVVAVCGAAYVIVALIVAVREARFSVALLQTIRVVVVGGIAAIPSIYVLLIERPTFWLANLRAGTSGAGITRFLPLRYVLGVSPVADPLKYGPPSLWQTPTGLRFAALATVVVLVLAVCGVAVLIARRQWAAVALFAAAAGYVGYLWGVAQYPYGVARTFCYLVPLSSVLLAVGAMESPLLLRRTTGDVMLPMPERHTTRRVRSGRIAERGAMLAGIGALAVVLFAHGFSSAVMEFGVINVGTLAPEAYRNLAGLAAIVPEGAAVYMANDGDSPAIRKEIGAALALPDRKVTVANHPFVHRDPVQEETTLATGFRAYDFVLLPTKDAPRIAGNAVQVWQDDDLKLTLFKRTGSRIAYGHRPNTPMMEQITARLTRQLAAAGIPTDAPARDALLELARVYVQRTDLQGRFGTPETVNFPALLAWATMLDGTPDADAAKLAPFVPQYLALETRLAPTSLRTVAVLP